MEEIIHFQTLLNTYNSTCRNPLINVVKARKDAFNTDIPESRSWSLDSNTFQSFLDASTSVHSTRFAIDDKETCGIPPSSAKRTCEILSKFSTVQFAGDSLNRHMTQALYMLLSNDFYHGSFPHHVSQPDSVLDNCKCDGQLSESHLCRDFHAQYSFTNATSVGLCRDIPWYVSPSFVYLKMDNSPGEPGPSTDIMCVNSAISHTGSSSSSSSSSSSDNSSSSRDSSDNSSNSSSSSSSSSSNSSSSSSSSSSNSPTISTKPTPPLHLIALHAGSHLEFKAKATISVILEPMLQRLNHTIEQCNHDIRPHILLVIFGLPAVHPIVAAKYPNQKHELAMKFHEEVIEYMGQRSPVATVFLDFLEITKVHTHHPAILN